MFARLLAITLAMLLAPLASAGPVPPDALARVLEGGMVQVEAAVNLSLVGETLPLCDPTGAANRTLLPGNADGGCFDQSEPITPVPDLPLGPCTPVGGNILWHPPFFQGGPDWGCIWGLIDNPIPSDLLPIGLNIHR